MWLARVHVTVVYTVRYVVMHMHNGIISHNIYNIEVKYIQKDGWEI